MARFVRKNEAEPVMRLERPSSASAQTTAHVINSCFNEILGQKRPDSKIISNLAVSRRGERDYHGTFVAALKKVSDDYDHRLEELSAVERHLVQAKARALADDERAMPASSVPGDVLIPRGPSQLQQHLDESLLSRHHLLLPGNYLPHPPAPEPPPQEDAPSYLKSTFTSSQHSAVPTDLHQKTASDRAQGKQASPRVPWQESLSAQEMEWEKGALAQLERRADHLRNPRYATSGSASFSPTKKSPMHDGLPAEEEGRSTIPAPRFFIAEPGEIIFTDYEVNHTYKKTVEFKNVSGASRHLRIVPLSSPYFSVSLDHHPSPDGIIAPGMHCSYTVAFTPDSLANYETELKVLTHFGECLSVPLKGIRRAPELSLPGTLDCGYCLAGCMKTVVLECRNSGGEGNFRLKCDGGQAEEEESPESLQVGSFSITPSEFYLPHGRAVQFTLVFTPTEAGLYSGQFHMGCDNGQVHSFTLKGVAEKVSVGCVFTGPSSSSEIAGFTSSHTHFQLEEEDPVITWSDHYHQYENVIERPCIEFDPVNPHNAIYRTAVIHNFSNVNLSYCWRLYRPIMESSDPTGLPGNPLRDGEAPLISSLIKSNLTAFSVRPSNGTLCAQEAKNFVFCFRPDRAGSFTDMAYLVLHGVPPPSLEPTSRDRTWTRLSDSEVAVTCVQLQGLAEPYCLELSPPLLTLPKSPFAKETRRRVKLKNCSLCTVHYCWHCSEGQIEVRVEPPSGSIEEGRSSWCEVVLVGREEGPFSISLQCAVEHSNYSMLLPVEGYIEGPLVTLDRPSVDFGLVPLGQSASVSLLLSSGTDCSLQFQLRQVVTTPDSGFMDHPCLSIAPSSGGLQPYGSASVVVECRPETEGRLRTVVECLINGEPRRHIEARAEVQCPAVCLDQCRVHVERAFLGIAVEREVALINNGLIPTQFAWSSQHLGSSARHCRLEFAPMVGRVGPRETVPVTIRATWTETGSQPEVVARCRVMGRVEPLVLLLSAEVLGLAVSYRVEDGSSPVVEDAPLTLEFGSDNPLGVPRTLSLAVTNTTAIPSSLTAFVRHFPPATPPSPPVVAKPGGPAVSNGRARFLLNRTPNIGDPTSKTQRQAEAVYRSALLREGRGCCFVVTPPSTALPPFHTATVTVTAYSDMWGQCEDVLVCEVPGLESRKIPLHYGASGCPLVFPSTATSEHTLIRFGSHAPDAETVKRVIKFTNTSPVELQVDWRTFNILQEDGQLVDLVSYIGEPFPRETRGAAPRPRLSLDSLDDSVFQHEGTSDDDIAGEGPLVRVHLRSHEGVRSDKPFDIHPKQMVIPPHSQATVQVSFRPSIRALNEMGDPLQAYALGYLTLQQQPLQHMTRKSSYEVQPLRIDINARVEHAKFLLNRTPNIGDPTSKTQRQFLLNHTPNIGDPTSKTQRHLTVECDEDHGLTFNYPASILLQGDQVQASASRSHRLTLLNASSSTLQFSLVCESQHFSLAAPELGRQSGVVLRPRKSIGVTVAFSVSRQDVVLCGESQGSSSTALLKGSATVGSSEQAALRDCIEYSGQLRVEFSTGAVQLLPLSARLALPSLTLSQSKLDCGTRLLGRPSSTAVCLTNTTTSDALWEAGVPPHLQGMVSVVPECGRLPAQISEGRPSTQLLQITVVARKELEYGGDIDLTEIVTGMVKKLKVNYCGSADELYTNTLKST